MKRLFYFLICIGFTLLSACGSKDSKTTQDNDPANTEAVAADPKLDKGVGPITSITLDEKIDEAMAKKGTGSISG